MKPHRILLVPLTILMLATMAQSQQRSANPQGRGQLSPDVLRELEAVVQGAGGLQAQRIVRWNTADVMGAWWTNTALVTRMGLTDDQKTRVERAFENHRQTLTTNTDQLTKEEAQLRKLLEADSIDRGAILTQIDRVIQARGELERANSAMTLEMREVLTKAQWMQLPQNGGPAFYLRTGDGLGIVAPGLRGEGGAGGRGTPGQRSGGQRQQ